MNRHILINFLKLKEINDACEKQSKETSIHGTKKDNFDAISFLSDIHFLKKCFKDVLSKISSNNHEIKVNV